MAVLLTRRVARSPERVEETVFARLGRNESDSFLYIVPTKRKLRELQRECLRAIPSATSPPLHIFTLETLSATLGALHFPPKFLVNGPTLAVLMQNAVARSADRLRYFRPRGTAAWLPRGTFQKIVDVITTLKEQGMYPAAMLAEVEGIAGPEQNKINDILTIYTEYEQILGETSIDTPGVLKELNARWDPIRSTALFRKRFPAVRDLLISGFDEFSDPELTLIFNLASMENLHTAVQFDYHTGNEALFGHLRQNYLKFIDMGFVEKKPPGRKRSSLQEHIAATLFNNPPRGGAAETPGPITILHARDRHDEVEMIAKLIKHLARRDPERELSSICVAMYQPQTYTSLFREAFGRYGIPANITDRFPLDQSPLVVSILSLLAVRQNNFQLRDVMKALSSPYIRIPSAGGTIDAGNLHATAVRLKIRGGLAAWKHRIDADMARIDGDLKRTDEAEEIASLELERSRLKRARFDILELDRILTRFDRRLTPGEFRGHLLDLLDDLRTPARILDVPGFGPGASSLEKDTRAYQQFLVFLDQLVVMLDMQGRNSVAEPLHFYIDHLRTALAHLRYNVRQRYGEGVLVTSFEETRGLRFDIMIVAGMVDGEFPPLYQPEVFLTPSRRERAERYHLTEHRYLFYQAITNHGTGLYLTVPAADGEVDLVPSTFLEALRECVAVTEFADERPHWVDDTIYTVDELLLQAGSRTVSSLPRYLNESPVGEEVRNILEKVHRAQEIESMRERNDPASEYNGTIAGHVGKAGKNALDKLRSRIYSVTQLETYGQCPFRYFAGRILRLNAVTELEEELTPLERGGLIHDILFEFHADRRSRQMPPISGCTDADFQSAVNDIREITRKKLDEMQSADLLWQVERELLTGSPERQSILEKYLLLERNQPGAVQPSYFEAGFGSTRKNLQSMDPEFVHSDPLIAGNVRLRGKVDRIDAGNGKFTIIDYKSGYRTPSIADMRSGMSLQLPVYLYAVEQILLRAFGRPFLGVGAFYVKFFPEVKRSAGCASREHAGETFVSRGGPAILPSDEDLRRLIGSAIEYVNRYVNEISRGSFPVAPADPASMCRYCDFKPACRIQSRPILSDEQSARGTMRTEELNGNSE